MNMQSLKAIARVLRSLGPYLLIELLLPGGTLLALLLYLSQHRRSALRRLALQPPHQPEFNRGGDVIELRARSGRTPDRDAAGIDDTRKSGPRLVASNPVATIKAGGDALLSSRYAAGQTARAA